MCRDLCVSPWLLRSRSLEEKKKDAMRQSPESGPRQSQLFRFSLKKKDSRAKIWFGDLLSVNRSVVVKSVIGSGRYCCTLPRNLCSHGPITVRPSLSTTTSTEQVRHVACSVYTIDCLLSTTTSFSDSFRDCCIPLAELNGWNCDTETVVWMRCCVVHFRASGGKLLAAPLP